MPFITSLEIIYQDDHLVAVDKPAGLLVHRSKIDVRARNYALQTIRNQIGRPVFPVHRLDRPTSGVLLFALSSEVARLVSNQFEKRTIEKNYTAIVRGVPPKLGKCEIQLLEKPDRVVDQRVDPDKAARSATTKFETLGSWQVPYSAGKYSRSRYSLVKIRPVTGRRHQIRRHFKHMAYPIIGDTTHGDRRHNRLFRKRFDLRRLMLVASELKLSHPITSETITICAELGGEFERALECLGLHEQLAHASTT